jgi:hypothetical protein
MNIDFSRGLPKYELFFILFLIFCAVIMVVVYDGFQKRTSQALDEAIEIPPIVANKIDIQIFDRLRRMKH